MILTYSFACVTERTLSINKYMTKSTFWSSKSFDFKLNEIELSSPFTSLQHTDNEM